MNKFFVSKLSTVCVLFMITACAHTPNEILEIGDQDKIVVTKPPHEAALCIQRNIEEYIAQALTEIREGSSSGKYELILRAPDGQIISIFQIERASKGSLIDVHTEPWLLTNHSHLVTELGKGC